MVENCRPLDLVDIRGNIHLLFIQICEQNKMAITEKTTSKDKPWVSYNPEEYQVAINEMVHHSFKMTHSAVQPGGVRVSSEDALELPYISVRTLMGSGQTVLTDTFGKGPSSINIHQQITSVACGAAHLAPPEDVSIIEGYLAEASKNGYVKCDPISPRLRQILLPTDAGYLAVTPLSAAGVGLLLTEALERLNNRIDEQNKDKKNTVKPLKKIKRGRVPLGGSKPFNVGNLVYKTTSPLIASFPTAENTLRYALSLHHNGVTSLRFPDTLVHEYTAWRNELAGATDSNQAAREEHRGYLKRFVRHWLTLGADAHDIICEHRSELPDPDKLLSSALSAFEQGLIDPEVRDSHWNYLFASRLAKRLSVLEFETRRRFEYSQSDINTIATMVRDILA